MNSCYTQDCLSVAKAEHMWALIFTFLAVASGQTPLCRFVQTTFPTCNTTCVATCTAPVCVTVCATNDCSSKSKCTHNCTGAVYDNVTCPSCPLVCDPLVCHPEDNCEPDCVLGNCSWACTKTRSSLCQYPRFEEVCDPTQCVASASALAVMTLSMLY